MIYNVTINKGDGTNPIVKQITYGEVIGELPEGPEKEGHTFIGWIDEPSVELSQ